MAVTLTGGDAGGPAGTAVAVPVVASSVLLEVRAVVAVRGHGWWAGVWRGWRGCCCC